MYSEDDTAILKLIKQAKDTEEVQRNCQHNYFPDGESQITPGTVRAWVCERCGQRLSNLPSKYLLEYNVAITISNCDYVRAPELKAAALFYGLYKGNPFHAGAKLSGTSEFYDFPWWDQLNEVWKTPIVETIVGYWPYLTQTFFAKNPDRFVLDSLQKIKLVCLREGLRMY